MWEIKSIASQWVLIYFNFPSIVPHFCLLFYVHCLHTRKYVNKRKNINSAKIVLFTFSFDGQLNQISRLRVDEQTTCEAPFATKVIDNNISGSSEIARNIVRSLAARRTW